MVIDREVVLTGSMHFTSGAAQNSKNVAPDGDLGRPEKFFVERLQPPQIVGQIDNAVLERVRLLRWRAFDRVFGFFVLFRLWIFDRIRGPEPPTPADRKREADHERLVRALLRQVNRSSRLSVRILIV